MQSSEVINGSAEKGRRGNHSAMVNVVKDGMSNVMQCIFNKAAKGKHTYPLFCVFVGSCLP